jgi:CRP-like cAMP-binding protein
MGPRIEDFVWPEPDRVAIEGPSSATSSNEVRGGQRSRCEPAPTTLASLEIPCVIEEIEIDEADFVEDAGETTPPGRQKAVPRVPLFSDLAPEAFMDLAARSVLRCPVAGDAIIQEGEVGKAFYVLCAGSVKVVKRGAAGEVFLARLGEGSFFGEMAFLSGAPRVASVIAEEGAECLEISAVLLGELLAGHPKLGQVLKKFCRQRLLSNVMATSKLFVPFPRHERRALVDRFKAREVVAGESLMEEGVLSNGLFVVMSGELSVLKTRERERFQLTTLREGDLFGEISLLTRSAATATASATRRSTVLRMPREDFDEVISTHPQILALVSELSHDRLQEQSALALGRCNLEELVLV